MFVQLSRSLSFQASSPPSSRPALAKSASLKTDKAENPAGWKDMNGMEKLKVLEVDPYLTPHQTHLKYRVREYLKRRMEIDKYEGSLEDFAKGLMTAHASLHLYCADSAVFNVCLESMKCLY